MRSPAVLAIVVLSTSLLVSVPAGAVTLDDVGTLSKAGIAPEVLVALVEVNDRLYSLTVERLLEMKRSGVADRVLLALVRSGRASRARRAPVVTAVPEVPSPPPLVIGKRGKRSTRGGGGPGEQTVTAASGGVATTTTQTTIVQAPVVVATGSRSHPIRLESTQDPRRFNSFSPHFGTDACRTPTRRQSRHWGFGGRLRPGAWER